MNGVEKRTLKGPLDAGKKPWPYKAPSPNRSWTVYQDNWVKVIAVKEACPPPLCSGDDACGTYATLSWNLTKEREQNKQIRQIEQRASHGPRRPPAKDVTVTANRRPPPFKQHDVRAGNG